MKEFIGQWIGNADGEQNKGSLIVNLELEPKGLVGSATYQDNDPRLGTIFVDNLHLIPSSQEENEVTGTSNITPIRNDGTFFKNKNDIKSTYPDVYYAEYVTISAKITKRKLKLELKTSLGQSLTASLASHKPSAKSKYENEPNVKCWQSFKSKVSGLEPERYIFRGQPQPWPLQTLFHRKRRKDLNRYVKQDIPKLTELITPHLSNKIDINNPDEAAALYSIAQHHGYPTPMLDWTWSPFIAAFFAFRNNPGEITNKPVRIFAFDQIAWKECTPNNSYFLSSIPMLEVISAAPLGNDRLIPQQSVFTLTNLWDVESFIKFVEKKHKKKILYCFDLPLSERSNALHELSVMGVTAASMFPGLDGTCEALRGRMFGDLTEVPRSRIS